MNNCIKTNIYGMKVSYLETSKHSYYLTEEQEKWLEELAIKEYYDKKEKIKEPKVKKRRHALTISG